MEPDLTVEAAGKKMVALLGALEYEVAGIRRQMTVAGVVDGPGCRLYRGVYQDRDCLLVQTGPGKQRAETAARFVLERFPVGAVISFGFAGALHPGLRAGDVIICTMLYNGNGRSHASPAEQTLFSDASLLEPAVRAFEVAKVRYCCGSTVTVPEPVCSRHEKEKLHRNHYAGIVDMESYWVGRIAAEKRVPFLAVRAVSDTLGQGLPPFARLLDGNGSFLWKRALGYFALRPREMLQLPALYRSSRRARQSLTRCIGRLVASMEHPVEHQGWRQ